MPANASNFPSLDAALLEAKRTDGKLYIPSGLWLAPGRTIAAGTIRSSWKVVVDADKTLEIFGDGPATVLRRDATFPLPPNLPNAPSRAAPLIDVGLNGNGQIRLHDLSVDGNEAALSTLEAGGLQTSQLFDGVRTSFSVEELGFNPDRPGMPNGKMTLTFHGIERSVTRGDYVVRAATATRPAEVTFRNPPSKGAILRLYPWTLWEQQSNIAVAGKAGTQGNSADFENIWLTGCVADGIKVAGNLQDVSFNRIDAAPRIRRLRNDIQISVVPTGRTIIRNSSLDRFGLEAAKAELPATQSLTFSNVEIGASFYISYGGDETHHVNMVADRLNYYGLSSVNNSFFKLIFTNGLFTNCDLANLRTVQNSSLTFRDCRMSRGSNFNDPDAVIPFDVIQTIGISDLLFERVVFDIPPHMTSGSVCQFSKPIAGSLPTPASVTFRDCTANANIDYVVKAQHCTQLVMEGGQMGVAKAAIQIAASQRKSAISVSNPAAWTGALFDIVSPPASAVAKIAAVALSGTFDFPGCVPLSAQTRTGSAIDWSGEITGEITAIFIVEFDPNNDVKGFPGLFLRQRPRRKKWKYLDTVAYGQTAYSLI
jgi:hypothetical protein